MQIPSKIGFRRKDKHELWTLTEKAGGPRFNSLSYGSSQSSRKPWKWMMLDLMLVITFGRSNRSTMIKDMFLWNMSLDDHEDHSDQCKNNQKLFDEKDQYQFWKKVSGSWYNNMIRISQCRSHWRANTKVWKQKINRKDQNCQNQGNKYEN